MSFLALYGMDEICLLHAPRDYAEGLGFLSHLWRFHVFLSCSGLVYSAGGGYLQASIATRRLYRWGKVGCNSRGARDERRNRDRGWVSPSRRGEKGPAVAPGVAFPTEHGHWKHDRPSESGGGVSGSEVKQAETDRRYLAGGVGRQGQAMERWTRLCGLGFVVSGQGVLW